MELFNKTKLTVDLQVDFSKKLFWNSSKKTVITIELVLLAVTAIVLGLYIESWWIALICAILMIVIPVALSFMLNSATKKTLESASQEEDSLDAEMEYHFLDDKIYIKLSVRGYTNQFTYSYDQFIQIVETKDLFVFMIEGNQAFYVQKTGFFDGNVEELSNFLSQRLEYKKI